MIELCILHPASGKSTVGHFGTCRMQSANEIRTEADQRERVISQYGSHTYRAQRLLLRSLLETPCKIQRIEFSVVWSG